MTAPVTRPSAVTVSFWLWVATAAVNIVTALVLIGPTQEATARAASDQGADPATAVRIITVVMVLSAVFSAVRVLIAWFLLRGRNWARIVVTILGALAVLSTITQIGTADWLSRILAVVVMVAIVLLYLPASNAFFRRRA